MYAHFLYFLCHFHLNNYSQYQDALRDLQLTIEESYLIQGNFSKAVSYLILGITFQLVGDTTSARQAFKQSIELNSDSVTYSALRRLSLIS